MPKPLTIRRNLSGPPRATIRVNHPLTALEMAIAFDNYHGELDEDDLVALARKRATRVIALDIRNYLREYGNQDLKSTLTIDREIATIFRERFGMGEDN
jgi:hypothetical protein